MSIADQVAHRMALAQQFEARVEAADDDEVAGEVDVMDACLALSDRRIARRAPETVADLHALFVLFGQLEEWDDALYSTEAKNIAHGGDGCGGVPVDLPAALGVAGNVGPASEHWNARAPNS